jgi:hypothetical protein
MFGAQGTHRRQPVTGAVEALFDTGAEQLGEIHVQSHGAFSMK